MRNTLHNQHQHRTWRRFIHTLAAGIVLPSLLLAGCNWGGNKGEIKSKENNFITQKKLVQPSFGKMPVDESTSAAEVPGQIRENKNTNRIIVYKIKLPLGVFSGNDKIWRMVDEDALDSQTSLMLAQNGIRAAVIAQSGWPAIAKLLQGYSALTDQFVCRIDSGIAVELLMRTGIDQQTIFYIDRDLNLQGRTFDHCDNKFRLVLSRSQDTKEFLINLEPLVSAGTTQVVRVSGDMTPTRDQVRHDQTFENLRLWANVKPDQALILTPAHMKESPFSVGARFLADVDGTPPSETVLVFVPQK